MVSSGAVERTDQEEAAPHSGALETTGLVTVAGAACLHNNNNINNNNNRDRLVENSGAQVETEITDQVVSGAVETTETTDPPISGVVETINKEVSGVVERVEEDSGAQVETVDQEDQGGSCQDQTGAVEPGQVEEQVEQVEEEVDTGVKDLREEDKVEMCLILGPGRTQVEAAQLEAVQEEEAAALEAGLGRTQVDSGAGRSQASGQQEAMRAQPAGPVETPETVLEEPGTTQAAGPDQV